MKTQEQILADLRDIIDDIETLWGEVEGLEILLKKTKDSDGSISYSELKEVNLYYFTKTNIIKE